MKQRVKSNCKVGANRHMHDMPYNIFIFYIVQCIWHGCFMPNILYCVIKVSTFIYFPPSHFIYQKKKKKRVSDVPIYSRDLFLDFMFN